MFIHSTQDRILSLAPGLQIQARAMGGAPWWLAGGIAAANCVAAYGPKAAASLAASYINLANPGTHDAQVGVAPTLLSGWVSDGTKYLITDIIPSDNWSAICRFSNQTFTLNALFGSRKAGATELFEIYTYAEGQMYYSNAGYVTSNPITQGTLGIAGKSGYKNGLFDKTISPGVFTNPLTIYLLGTNLEGIFVYGTIGTMEAIAFYNIVLSPTQMLAVHTAMMAL